MPFSPSTPASGNLPVSYRCMAYQIWDLGMSGLALHLAPIHRTGLKRATVSVQRQQFVVVELLPVGYEGHLLQAWYLYKAIHMGCLTWHVMGSFRRPISKTGQLRMLRAGSAASWTWRWRTCGHRWSRWWEKPTWKPCRCPLWLTPWATGRLGSPQIPHSACLLKAP